MGPVGDLRSAAASGDTWPELRLGASAFLDALLCLRASSLCSLIRIDRLAGAISSPPDEAFDLERVWRDGGSWSSREGGRSLSESDVIAVEVEAMDRDLLDVLVADLRTAAFLVLRLSFSALSDMVEARTDWPSFFFRRDRVNGRAKWYKGAMTEKRPSS